MEHNSVASAPAPGAAPGGPASRPRRWWIIGLAAGVVAVAGMFLGGSPGGGRNRLVEFGFAGFTNVDGQPHVWLWVTNGARASLFRTGTVSHRFENAWVLEGYLAAIFHADVRAWPARGGWYPAHQPCLARMAVHEAKLPLRVGLDVWERPGGLTGVKERVSGWFAAHVLRKTNSVYTLIRYSVTNEFWPAP